MYCRGIRGATTVEHNEREEILAATTELLQLLIERNDLHMEDVASAIFTVTEDLDAEFPALAARYLGCAPDRCRSCDPGAEARQPAP